MRKGGEKRRKKRREEKRREEKREERREKREEEKRRGEEKRKEKRITYKRKKGEEPRRLSRRDISGEGGWIGVKVVCDSVSKASNPGDGDEKGKEVKKAKKGVTWPGEESAWVASPGEAWRGLKKEEEEEERRRRRKLKGKSRYICLRASVNAITQINSLSIAKDQNPQKPAKSLFRFIAPRPPLQKIPSERGKMELK